MESSLVELEYDESGQIATIWLNRPPKKNALNWEMFTLLSDYLDILSKKSEVRIIYIKSRVKDVFSAGIDVKLLAGLDPNAPKLNLKGAPFRYMMRTQLQGIFSKLVAIEKPTIAVIDGICYGSGFELILACDFRYATSNSVFQMKEAQLGIIPDLGGTTRITRLVNPSFAKEICIAARSITASEAYRMGFVNDIAPSMDELLEKVNRLHEAILKAAPLAVGMGKHLIDNLYGESEEKGLDREAMTNSFLFTTKDHQRAVQAFLSKTKPQWKGK
ncbi:enoyl-CoA hydratase/isomerase family protein [Candidatus Harpocratesius sp.]